MSTYIKIWSGGGSVRFVDMTNAGRVGKVCRDMTIYGQRYGTFCDKEPYKSLLNATDSLFADIEHLAGEESKREGVVIEKPFDEVCALFRERAVSAGLNLNDRELKGVDAPKPVLTAGIPGVWSGRLDNDGVHLRDLTDMNNEPCMITIRQGHNTAYRKAAKVWALVCEAKTMRQASELLGAAGCNLHYYCAMD